MMGLCLNSVCYLSWGEGGQVSARREAGSRCLWAWSAECQPWLGINQASFLAFLPSGAMERQSRVGGI